MNISHKAEVGRACLRVMGALLPRRPSQMRSTTLPDSVCFRRKLAATWIPGLESRGWIWTQHNSPESVHRTGAARRVVAGGSNLRRRHRGCCPAATYLSALQIEDRPRATTVHFLQCILTLVWLAFSFLQPWQVKLFLVSKLLAHTLRLQPQVICSFILFSTPSYSYPERVYRRVHQTAWSPS